MGFVEKQATAEHKQYVDTRPKSCTASSILTIWQLMMRRLAIGACKKWAGKLVSSGISEVQLNQLATNIISRSTFTCFEVYNQTPNYLPGRFSLAPLVECEIKRTTHVHQRIVDNDRNTKKEKKQDFKEQQDPCYIFLCCLVHHTNNPHKFKNWIWKDGEKTLDVDVTTSNLYLIGFVRADHVCVKLASWAEPHLEENTEWRKEIELKTGVNIEQRSLMVPLDVFTLDVDDLMEDRQVTLSRRARQTAKRLLMAKQVAERKENNTPIPAISPTLQSHQSHILDYASDYETDDDELKAFAPTLLSRTSAERAASGKATGNNWNTSVYVPHWDPPVSAQDVNALARNQGFSLSESSREMICMLKKCHYSYYADDQLPIRIVKDWISCSTTNMSPFNRNRYATWLLVHVFCHAEELRDFFVKAYEIFLRCQLMELKEPADKVAVVTVNRLKIDLLSMGDNYTFEDQVCALASSNLSRILQAAVEWHGEQDKANSKHEEMKPAMLNLVVSLIDLAKEYKVHKKGYGGKLRIVKEVQDAPSTERTIHIKKKKE